jgi:hypothetical protein
LTLIFLSTYYFQNDRLLRESSPKITFKIGGRRRPPYTVQLDLPLAAAVN